MSSDLDIGTKHQLKDNEHFHYAQTPSRLYCIVRTHKRLLKGDRQRLQKFLRVLVVRIVIIAVPISGLDSAPTVEKDAKRWKPKD